MAWNAQVLKLLGAISATTGVDLTPYLSQGNTNTAATNTALATTNSTLSSINTVSTTTNTLLGTLNANTALVAWQENALKGGTLYLGARYTASLAAAGNMDSIVLVGSKPILLYAQVLFFEGPI
ncbi:hypothetical protein [Erwinia phage Pecta]|nr:hypothetical protein [Erwinia phage Pecta]